MVGVLNKINMDQLIKGKWYKVLSYKNTYYKFDKLFNKNILKMSEYYNGTSFSTILSAANEKFWENCRLATIKELKTFLPKNHKDLKCKTYELW